MTRGAGANGESEGRVAASQPVKAGLKGAMQRRSQHSFFCPVILSYCLFLPSQQYYRKKVNDILQDIN